MTHVKIYDLWEQRAYRFPRDFKKLGSQLYFSRAPGLLRSSKGMWSSAGGFFGRLSSAGWMDAVWLQTHNIAGCLIPLAAMLLSSTQCQKPSCCQSAFAIVPMVTVVLESVSAPVPASLEHFHCRWKSFLISLCQFVLCINEMCVGWGRNIFQGD